MKVTDPISMGGDLACWLVRSQQFQAHFASTRKATAVVAISRIDRKRSGDVGGGSARSSLIVPEEDVSRAKSGFSLLSMMQQSWQIAKL
ncbi:hypothetical protein [Novipirellula caenicola]|uniref:hypothetical protein n=1 Tax=Novipirellula caenicola TaxID=1536901 RepID=UPI0031E6AAF1